MATATATGLYLATDLQITVQVTNNQGVLEWSVVSSPALSPDKLDSFRESAKRKLLLKSGERASLVYTARLNGDQVSVHMAPGSEPGVLWPKDSTGGIWLKNLASTFAKSLVTVRREITAEAAKIFDERRPNIYRAALAIFRDPDTTAALRTFPEYAEKVEELISERVRLMRAASSNQDLKSS